VRKFTQYELRQLYADSCFMVMPLENVKFQAGVTAILWNAWRWENRSFVLALPAKPKWWSKARTGGMCRRGIHRP
jgi:hypothetical protein